jgi:hypothetical protein
MNQPKPKGAPAWLYVVAIILLLVAAACAFILSYAPRLLLL